MPGIRLLPVLLVLPAVAAAQGTPPPTLPAPCSVLGGLVSVKPCLSREAMMVDTMLDASFHAALESLRDAARDSLLADQQAWADAHARALAAVTEPTARLASDLVAKRSRIFRLRHLVLYGAAAVDTTRLRLPPAQIAFRPEGSGRGLVLRITNLGGRPLEVTARFYNPATDELWAKVYRIMPNARQEVSWLDGWTFAAGHFVQLLSAQYAPVLAVAP